MFWQSVSCVCCDGSFFPKGDECQLCVFSSKFSSKFMHMCQQYLEQLFVYKMSHSIIVEYIQQSHQKMILVKLMAHLSCMLSIHQSTFIHQKDKVCAQQASVLCGGVVCLFYCINYDFSIISLVFYFEAKVNLPVSQPKMHDHISDLQNKWLESSVKRFLVLLESLKAFSYNNLLFSVTNLDHTKTTNPYFSSHNAVNKLYDPYMGLEHQFYRADPCLVQYRFSSVNPQAVLLIWHSHIME